MPQDPQDKTELTLDEFREQARKRYGIPKGLWESVRGQESGGNTDAVSPTGVRGEFQVTQKTAGAYGLNRDDPFHQIAAAAKNLREGYDKHKKQFGDDNQRWIAASAYYYGGPDAVKPDGTFNTASKDNISNPANYATSIAQRWKEYNDTQPAPVPKQPTQQMRFNLNEPTSKPITPESLLSMGLQSRPPTPQSRRLAADETARMKATPQIARMVEDFEALKREGSVDAARGVAAKIKQQYGKWMEVGEGDGWPYVKSKVRGWNPVQPLAVPITTPSLGDQQAAFSRKPLLDQWSERAEDALTRGGGLVSRMARQAVGAGAGVIQGLNSGDFTPVDFPTWRQGEEERFKNLEARRQARPSSFATDVAEGIIEAAPAASAAILGTMLTGGGAPTAALIGGGMGAAGADWRDPERALAQTAIGAAAPVIGGKAGQAIGGRVASRLAAPVAQQLARVGGEALGGGVGNVVGTGAEQFAFEGKLNPRELARSGAVGLGLSLPGAIGASRRSVSEVPQSRTRSGAIIAQPSTQELNPETFGYIPGRKLLPPGNPNEVPTEQLTPRTRPLVYPDAPETQEMPAFKQRLAAENAPTAELPRVTAPTRTTAPEPPPRRPTERLPVPKATGENIQTLRSRQEELGRLAYDRRGDFTGDLRDEYNQITAAIRDYENAKAPREIGPPPGQRPEAGPNPAEREARRAALQPRTTPFPPAETIGRKVTQETQLPPGMKPSETFSSREDARQGHFERFNDEELVDEIRRMEDVRNQATRGRSKLNPEELEANNFDLKVAVEMQKERGRLQRQIGIEPAQRIAPRTPSRPARKIQHSSLGEVTEAENQSGVPKGKLRVTGEDGEHIIQNPRTRGNQSAAFVRSIPAEAMPELTAPGAPRSPLAGREIKAGRKIDYTIPAEAMPELAGKTPDIVRGMKKIMRSPSSPVEITKLREQLPGMSKTDFDAQMTRLNEQGRIALHRHDQPSEFDRAGAVKIGNDYFTAATLREGKGHVMGGIFGGLQPLFEGRAKIPKPGQQELFKESRRKPADNAGLGSMVGGAFRTASQGLRTFKTAFDLSAPLSQGAVLTRAHPLKGAQAFGKMLRSLKPSESAAIDQEILNHPLRKLGDQFDLHIATGGAPEEAFMLGKLNKAPGVAASERTYRTYLDTLRLSVWESYVKSLQSSGYTPENSPRAYKQAAEFINIATGRGSLRPGGKLANAMALGGDVLFAPRNLAAKFQLLDPVRYAKLEPGARKLVLRDALTSFGSIAATAIMLRQAGVRVGLNPTSDDFMEARWGNHRFDLTAGLKTEVKFLAKMVAGTYNKASGEGNLPGGEPLDVAKNYARGKLAPGPALVYDALAGSDFKGQKISEKSKTDLAVQFGPMIAEDLREGYKDSGVSGMLKSSPSFIGQRVSVRPDRAKSAFINTPESLRAEQKKSGEPRSFLTPRPKREGQPDETPAAFADRKTRADEWSNKYGSQLVESGIYQRATAEEKEAAREYLKKQIVAQTDEKRPSLYLLTANHILQTVRELAREKRRKAR